MAYQVTAVDHTRGVITVTWVADDEVGDALVLHVSDTYRFALDDTFHLLPHIPPRRDLLDILLDST